MENVGTVTLRTPRLILRRIVPEDAAALHAAGSLTGTPEEVSAVAESIAADYETPYTFHWAIEYDGHAVGRVKAWDISMRDDYAQLGYDIHPGCRNLGLMTEAVQAVTDYLLSAGDFHRVYCMVRESNRASCRVCEKAGFRLEGTLRGHFRENDGFVDVRVYGRLKEDMQQER